MPEENRNIYQTARQSAGLTQEAAAERLAVSVESLRAYENGYRVPANDIVARMAVTYNNLMLGYNHCLNTNSLMASIVPELEERSLLELAVRIAVRVERLAGNGGARRLLEIFEDSAISPEEQADFDRLWPDLREIIRAGLELDILCREERSDG